MSGNMHDTLNIILFKFSASHRRRKSAINRGISTDDLTVSITDTKENRGSCGCHTHLDANSSCGLSEAYGGIYLGTGKPLVSSI